MNDSINEGILQNCISIDPPTRNIDIAWYLQSTNHQGRVQKTIISTLSALSFLCGVTLFCIPYVFYQPDFRCRRPDGTFSPCPESIACQASTEYRLVSGILLASSV